MGSTVDARNRNGRIGGTGEAVPDRSGGEPGAARSSADPPVPSPADRHDMPSEVTGRLGFFDRFAGVASHFVSRAPFFAACVLLVVVWAPSFFLLGDVDTWQLIINTATTIVTFLLVALLQNSQYRTDAATQHKLNAIAQGLAELMDHIGEGRDLRDEVIELTDAVGLERRETSN